MCTSNNRFDVCPANGARGMETIDGKPETGMDLFRRINEKPSSW